MTRTLRRTGAIVLSLDMAMSTLAISPDADAPAASFLPAGDDPVASADGAIADAASAVDSEYKSTGRYTTDVVTTDEDGEAKVLHYFFYIFSMIDL